KSYEPWPEFGHASEDLVLPGKRACQRLPLSNFTSRVPWTQEGSLTRMGGSPSRSESGCAPVPRSWKWHPIQSGTDHGPSWTPTTDLPPMDVGLSDYSWFGAW